MRDLKIGKIVLQPCERYCSHDIRNGESSGPGQFKAEHCIDSDLATSCRPEGSGPHAISVELLGPDGVEFDIKSVTIYTPPPHHATEGYNPQGHEIKVSF